MFFPEDQQLFTVSELAHACGVSRATLIRIEECGILTPFRIDPKTGYRYYNAYNAAQVGQYLLLQSLSLTRDEIAEYYYQKVDSSAFLKEQKERLDRMKRILEELEIRSRKVSGISFSYIDLPEQTCFCLESELSSPEEGELFFFKAHEQCIKEGFQLLGTEPLFGISSSDWHFSSSQFDAPAKTTACIPVRAHEKSDPRLMVFPAVHAFAGVAYGDYSMIGKLSLRFWQEIIKRGVQPAGPVRFYGLMAPYAGNHLTPEHYCYRMVVPVESEECGWHNWEQYTAVSDIRFCSNPCVNGLLNYYAGLAEAQHIDFSARAVCDQLPFSNADVTILLGNALDNAVHAASEFGEALPDSRPEIRFNADTINDQFAIQIDNSCLAVSFAPASQKGNRAGGEGWLPADAFKSTHSSGYGLKSMEMITGKYGGHAWFSFDAKNRVFVTRLMLPVSKV